MRKLILVTIWITIQVTISAQEVQILDKISLSPIKHVQVDVLGKRVTTLFTNVDGMVSLKDCAPNDTLLLNHVSYGAHTVPISSIRSTGYIIHLNYKFIDHPEITIYSPREKSIASPQQVKEMTLKEIQLLAPSTAASLLEATGQVMVQRSQLGGGSPILRGFEANKVLLVVDGVRMNNAIYRSGHLQNAISIDPNILESTEVIFGASSLIYGSDALGGVIHYKSIQPAFSDSSFVKANVAVKYASATQENTAHAHLQFLGKRISTLTSISFTDFGDLRMGAVRKHGDEDWGLVKEYVETNEDGDQIKSNPNPLIQKHTGYSQLDFLQKIRMKLNENIQMTANVQYSTSSDIPRFDRYNDYKNGALKFATWDYGPQNRLLASLNTNVSLDGKLADRMNIIVAYQKIDEDRITRKFGSDTKFTRFEDVQVGSLNTDFIKKLGGDKKFYYGIEITYNDVQSKALSTTLSVATISASRYPSGGSQLGSEAVYFSFLNPFHEKWQYNAGLRYSAIQSSSVFNSDSQPYDLPFDEISLSNNALTYSLGLKFEPNDNTSFHLMTSTGFRAPNVDDYGKIFERDGFLVIPNEDLSPEFTVNEEIGFQKRIKDKFQIDANIYITQLKDAIVRRDYHLNGQDSLAYEGELARVQSNQNIGQARIYGYFIGLKYQPMDKWKISAVANYTVGEDVSGDVPLAHIPPFFAKGEISYKTNKLQTSFYVHYHDLKSKSKISPGRTDNSIEGLNGQFPSWYTLNANFSYEIIDGISAQVMLENILDHHYKVYASGMSAPGRNLILVLRANIN